MSGAVKKPKGLPEIARAKWASSGLTDAHAAALRFQVLTGEEVRQLSDQFHATGALKIPYFDLKGRPTSFYRLRYLQPLPGFAGQVEKPQRYAQLKGTLNEPYLPPILEASWEDIADDTAVPIYITEGELKAAAGAAAGLAVVGLGGVDVWRSTKRGIELLPPLSTFAWTNRTVVVVFDSDAATNENVVRAQRQLAAELLSRGAIPAIASLPPAADGAKQGLDDFLVAQGPAELLEVLKDAPLYPEADALWSLNEEVVFVREPPLVIERSSGTRIEPGKFVNTVYANRHYVEAQPTKNGGVVAKKKPLAKRWVEWEGRFEVKKIVYEPGKPRVWDGCWNAWEGWGCQPKKGDVTLWLRLLDHIFKGDPAQQWFERWAAYPLQHPGTKLYTSVLLWSVKQGTGKTLLSYMLKAIYGSNGIEIDSDALRASFNAWAQNRQFVIGDEITANEARLDKEKLKSLITRSHVTINAKYMPEYQIRDCINYLFNSNNPDALFVEDFDRRHFIWEVVGDPAPRRFYEECDAWLRSEGPSALFYHLLNLDLGTFNPREHALSTRAKEQMIVVGKSDLGLWCRNLKEQPEVVLRQFGEKVAAKGELFTPTQLLRCYDPDNTSRVRASAVAKELVKAGFSQVNGGQPIRVKGGLARLYAIRNVDKWKAAAPRDAAAHFDTVMDELKF